MFGDDNLTGMESPADAGAAPLGVVAYDRPAMDSYPVDGARAEKVSASDLIGNLSFFQRAALYASLAPHLFTIARGYFMQDWKTTVTGAIKALLILLATFGIHVPDAIQDNFVTVLGMAWAVIEAVQGWFAKDK